MSSIICTSKVKEFALQTMTDKGRKQFTRVSKEFTDRAEAHLRSWIRSEMHSHPAIGSTIK